MHSSYSRQVAPDGGGCAPRPRMPSYGGPNQRAVRKPPSSVSTGIFYHSSGAASRAAVHAVTRSRGYYHGSTMPRRTPAPTHRPSARPPTAAITVGHEEPLSQLSQGSYISHSSAASRHSIRSTSGTALSAASTRSSLPQQQGGPPCGQPSLSSATSSRSRHSSKMSSNAGLAYKPTSVYQHGGSSATPSRPVGARGLQQYSHVSHARPQQLPNSVHQQRPQQSRAPISTSTSTYWDVSSAVKSPACVSYTPGTGFHRQDQSSASTGHRLSQVSGEGPSPPFYQGSHSTGNNSNITEHVPTVRNSAPPTPQQRQQPVLHKGSSSAIRMLELNSPVNFRHAHSGVTSTPAAKQRRPQPPTTSWGHANRSSSNSSTTSDAHSSIEPGRRVGTSGNYDRAHNQEGSMASISGASRQDPSSASRVSVSSTGTRSGDKPVVSLDDPRAQSYLRTLMETQIRDLMDQKGNILEMALNGHGLDKDSIQRILETKQELKEQTLQFSLEHQKLAKAFEEQKEQTQLFETAKSEAIDYSDALIRTQNDFKKKLKQAQDEFDKKLQRALDDHEKRADYLDTKTQQVDDKITEAHGLLDSFKAMAGKVSFAGKEALSVVSTFGKDAVSKIENTRDVAVAKVLDAIGGADTASSASFTDTSSVSLTVPSTVTPAPRSKKRYLEDSDNEILEAKPKRRRETPIFSLDRKTKINTPRTHKQKGASAVTGCGTPLKKPATNNSVIKVVSDDSDTTPTKRPHKRKGRGRLFGRKKHSVDLPMNDDSFLSFLR